MKTKITKSVAVMVFSAISIANLNAQTRNDVVKVFNEGARALQTNLPVAIESFENVIKLSDQVGDSAADLRGKAIKVLPGLYFKVAYKAMNEKKPAREIIGAAKKAISVAEKYDDTSTKVNAGKIMVQSYNTMATDYFSQNDYANALATYDTLLSINPDYFPAIYNKALIYIKQDSAWAVERTMDLFISKLKSPDDSEKIKQASSTALEYFRSAGSQADQAGKLDEALALLNTGAKYGNDKELFYFFSDVYNKMKNFDKGEEYAKKGLDLETGVAEAKAKYYFQLGLAMAGKGQTSEACGALKNAMYGAFAAAAKTERANLKCQ